MTLPTAWQQMLCHDLSGARGGMGSSVPAWLLLLWGLDDGSNPSSLGGRQGLDFILPQEVIPINEFLPLPRCHQLSD